MEEQVELQQASQPAPNNQMDSGVAARQRERQALELQRERVLDERTSNPIRRQALESALKEIEEKLAAL